MIGVAKRSTKRNGPIVIVDLDNFWSLVFFQEYDYSRKIQLQTEKNDFKSRDLMIEIPARGLTVPLIDCVETNIGTKIFP